jgi:hypothetical protein
VQFAELAAAYERLEATSKRLEMRAILVELIRPIRPPDLAPVLYLSQGMLRPEYEGVELGVADSLARRARSVVGPKYRATWGRPRRSCWTTPRGRRREMRSPSVRSTRS